VPDEQPQRGIGRGRIRGRRETPLELAERIADAYGLVLLLIIITFVVMMTLPPEGWGGRVAAIAVAALTAIVAFTSSDVRSARVRLAAVVAGVAVAAAAVATAVSSERLLALAFGIVAIMLAVAAVTILRRVVGAREVDFRTILGAISVFTLLGLLFGFFYFALSRWGHEPFFAGHAAARSSDYLFFSYTTLTTTGYGNLVPAGRVGESFAVLEMLVGQIFLVTLVAGLVSLWRPGSARAPAGGTDA
jgi:hypothetical protein